MAALQHVYLTAHGSYGSGIWVGEQAQMGVRLAITDATAEPAKGTTFNIANNGDVVVDSGSQAGTHGSLTRTWSARLGPVGNSENADAAWQVDLAEDFWTFLDSLKTLNGPGFRWTHVKIAPITDTGAYGGPAATYTFTTPIAAGGSAALPPEVALALTFRAPIIGRRGRGRMYFPALSQSAGTINTDGTVATAAGTSLLAAMATFVTNLENSPGTEAYGPTVMVTSAGKSSGVRPSMIRVGNHFDVQKRRQAQIVETYQTTAL